MADESLQQIFKLTDEQASHAYVQLILTDGHGHWKKEYLLDHYEPGANKDLEEMDLGSQQFKEDFTLMCQDMGLDKNFKFTDKDLFFIFAAIEKLEDGIKRYLFVGIQQYSNGKANDLQKNSSLYANIYPLLGRIVIHLNKKDITNDDSVIYRRRELFAFYDVNQNVKVEKRKSAVYDNPEARKNNYVIAGTTASPVYASLMDNYRPEKHRLQNGEKLFADLPLPKVRSFFDISDPETIEKAYKTIGTSKTQYSADGVQWKYNPHLYAGLRQYYRFLTSVKDKSDYDESGTNLIYFGAPGTGKSYQLNQQVNFQFENRFERITFYSDYMHSQFVGSYQPITVNEGKTSRVEYQFRPGPFIRVMMRALNDPTKPYALVIEELNRAEAASVFGQVFQLLDRDEEHKSMYPVAVSENMREYLNGKSCILTEEGRKRLSLLTNDSSSSCSRIVIPPNMSILATMNSADQSVFPLDTAFKRRWDFEYIDIDAGANKDVPDDELVIVDVDWAKKYRIAINKLLRESGVGEDKLIGPFFLGSTKLEMGRGYGDHSNDPFDKAMKNKVIMYLFEDAAKYHPSIVFDLDALGMNENELSLSALFRMWDELDYGIFVGLPSVRPRKNDLQS